TLLPLDAPKVRAYPLETVIAEKFDAVVRLGRANSRMKDFHDLYTLAARRSFDGELLTKAVQATFERRKADLTLVPAVLAPEFYTDDALGQRWRAFVKGQPIGTQIEPKFPGIGEQLRPFLGPLASATVGSLVLVSWDRANGWASRTP
ncbi:MAG: nucleotidyl transferase AbiEii/AbiGii toxin family protein, partial [Planctomycetota bacterium]